MSTTIGTPGSRSATRLMLLGSGELGKEVAIEAQRLGIEVIAVDRYAHAPAMQVAHRSHVIRMLDAEALREMGPDAAYRSWLLAGLPAHFIGYYVLVMALQDRPWNDCKGDEKKALRVRFEALKAECNASGRSALESALNYFGVLDPRHK